MAYPVGTLSLTLEDVDRRIKAIKTRSQQWINQMGSGQI